MHGPLSEFANVPHFFWLLGTPWQISTLCVVLTCSAGWAAPSPPPSRGPAAWTTPPSPRQRRRPSAAAEGARPSAPASATASSTRTGRMAIQRSRPIFRTTFGVIQYTKKSARIAHAKVV